MDLFEKRYEIFKASRTIIEIYMSHGFDTENPRHEEAVAALKKVDEAIFTCGEKGRAFCNRLEYWHRHRQVLTLMLQSQSEISKIKNLSDMLKESQESLLRLNEDINRAFESELRIKRPY